MESSRKVEIIGHYGAILSLIEVGLGSLLHSLHIPLAGVFLSLNQGYLLCRVAIASRETDDRWLPYSVANVAAVLKSLSPAGQKLGPMLSLSMQGLLFNLGTWLVGINLLGLCLGMALMSWWSFFQPLITYYLFFGDKIIDAAQFLYQKTLPWHQLEPRHLGWIFAALVLLKALVAVLLAIMAWKSKGSFWQQDQLIKIASQTQQRSGKKHSALVMAGRDLLRPLFLLSLTSTGLFLFYSQHPKAQIAWYLMRPIAIGFMFFYFSRTLTLDRWMERLEQGRFNTFARGCKLALLQIRKVL